MENAMIPTPNTSVIGFAVFAADQNHNTRKNNSIKAVAGGDDFNMAVSSVVFSPGSACGSGGARRGEEASSGMNRDLRTRSQKGEDDDDDLDEDDVGDEQQERGRQ
jgi:hypothetical protein